MPEQPCQEVAPAPTAEIGGVAVPPTPAASHAGMTGWQGVVLLLVVVVAVVAVRRFLRRGRF